MNESIAYLFLRRIFHVWGESWYLKPVLEIVGLYSAISIFKGSNAFGLRRIGLLFCGSIFILFFALDIMIGTNACLQHKLPYDIIVQIFELANGAFSFVEFYCIYQLVNFSIAERRLAILGRIAGIVLLGKELLVRWYSLHSSDLNGFRALDEFSSGVSFALFTIYFTYYYYILYKRDIMSTFVTPSVFMLFSYVVLSLLFFPYSYWNLMVENPIGYLINSYHMLLAALCCLVFRYNVRCHKAEKVSFLKFRT